LGFSGCSVQERPEPAVATVQDQEFHIALDSLPADWSIEWAKNDEAPKRLKMLSPQKDAIVEVFSFKGSLNRDKFDHIDTLLFGSALPNPYQTLKRTEYGKKVKRSKYIRKTEEARQMYSTLDLVWYEAREDYAYIVMASSFQQEDSDLQTARAKLHFYPPKSTVFGNIQQMLGSVGGWIMKAIAGILLLVGWNVLSLTGRHFRKGLLIRKKLRSVKEEAKEKGMTVNNKWTEQNRKANMKIILPCSGWAVAYLIAFWFLPLKIAFASLFLLFSPVMGYFVYYITLDI
jgi:hypothetical protein